MLQTLETGLLSCRFYSSADIAPFASEGDAAGGWASAEKAAFTPMRRRNAKPARKLRVKELAKPVFIV
jgi:hypothetical protein